MITVSVELINGYTRVFSPCTEPEYDDEVVKFNTVDEDGNEVEVDFPMRSVAYWAETKA